MGLAQTSKISLKLVKKNLIFFYFSFENLVYYFLLFSSGNSIFLFKNMIKRKLVTCLSEFCDIFGLFRKFKL